MDGNYDPGPPPARARTISLGQDRSLHLLEAGSGRPIVLIHGAVATHLDWLDAPLAGFARRGRVLAIDRPGHGESLRPRFQASPHDQAAQIREGLKLLGVERPLLVGHSFGGSVALAYAADFPDEPAGLLLLAPVSFPEIRPVEHALFGPRAPAGVGPLISLWAGGVDAVALPILHRVMFFPQQPPPDWRARYPFHQVMSRPQMVEEGEDAAAILPWNPEGYVNLDAIRVPVHIVSGTADLITIPERHAKPLARRVKTANLTLLDGFGHMLHHCATDAVMTAADALLERALT